MLDILLAFAAALAGIAVGMIINVLSDDLPERAPIRLPHYPNGAPRPPLAWSGLLAFLTGQREGPSIEYSPDEEKRRDLSLEEIAHLAYDTTLSWRYPLVELSMAAIYAFIVFYAPSLERGLVWAAFIAILMLITVIDLEHRLILFVTTVPAIVFALMINALFPEVMNSQGDPRPFMEYVYGALLGGVTFFIMFLGGGVFADMVAWSRGQAISEVAFGFGDVMLAILGGAMIGWRAMLFAMLITVFAGAAGALAYMGWRLITGRAYTMYTPLPYGPYIVLGTVAMMLIGDEIRHIIY